MRVAPWALRHSLARLRLVATGQRFRIGASEVRSFSLPVVFGVWNFRLQRLFYCRLLSAVGMTATNLLEDTVSKPGQGDDRLIAGKKWKPRRELRSIGGRVADCDAPVRSRTSRCRIWP